MIKFLKNSLIIVLLLCATILLFELIDIKLNTQKNSTNNDIAFIGHSNIQTALNDSLISGKLNTKCRNYGTGGQSLFWTVISAKKLKSQGVNNFIISLDEVTYSTGGKTYNPSSGFKHMRYFKSFLNLNDWFTIINNDLKFGIKSLFVLPKLTLNFRGYYSKGKRPFFDDLTKNNRKTVIDVSDKILHDFIKYNPSSNFLIVKLPFHQNYYKKEKYRKNSQHLTNRLNSFKMYKNTLVLDYGKFLNNDSLFMDHSHLNYLGSNVISNEIAKKIIQTEFFSN